MKLITTGILIILFSSTIYSQERSKKIQLVESGTNTPVENALVYLPDGSFSTRSDEEGYFTLSGNMDGNAEILISHMSYNTKRITINELRNTGTIELVKSTVMLEGVEVRSTRADEDTPITFTNLSKSDIEKLNYGQDLPVLLSFTPSLVSTSDAGAGVGYTGMRIRGSDMTRINVTVNGIPLNDSESQGVFWVNTPDLSSSLSSLQIQRGVGTSTNGAGAFGATVNLQTSKVNEEPYANINNAVGSFNTMKNTIEVGTGMLPGKFSLDMRLSKIKSDGYIDRASSDLKSLYLSGGYFGDKTMIKMVVFSGAEKTYQSWWGTPEARLENDVEEMNWVADINGYTQEQRDNLLNSGRTFNYYLYDNEVDNYQQDHYQLHASHTFSSNFSAYGAAHYTYGRGYFEQYRNGEDFEDYDIQPIETPAGFINTTDLIRRRWLDNHFYGITYSFEYRKNDLDITLGGAANNYLGDHFGEIVWAQYSPNREIRDRYYDNNANKTDFNTFLKINKTVLDNLTVFGDLQVRRISYNTQGTDNDRLGGEPLPIDVDAEYNFFNPKAGMVYANNAGLRTYLSFAIANREPIRSDFIDNQNVSTPKPETLRNLEMGLSKKTGDLDFEINTYLMDYRDQLVLTGELNDVGASIRRNVDKSYRAGIETSLNYRFSENFSAGGNLSLSRNKISKFEEIIYDYGVAWDEFNIITRHHSNTDIAFSPSVVGAGMIEYNPMEYLTFSWLAKYVGKQFLDNTSNANRSIDPFFVNNLIAEVNLTPKPFKNLKIGFQVNNIFNTLYESNGYTYGYAGGGDEIRENYYYPQAGRNYMVSLNIGL